MRKKLNPALLLPLAAMLALLLVLAACNGQDDPTNTLAPTPTQPPAPTATPVPPAPTATAVPSPTATPRPAPTATPRPEPTATRMPVPTATPRPEPTATPRPTATPMPTPTPEPTQDPSTMMPAPVLTMLAPNVHYYFANGAGSLIVFSDDAALVVDSYNMAFATQLQEVVAGLTDAPVTSVVLTHEHYDHVGGTGVFEGATVYCHRNCQVTFDLHPSRTDPEWAIPLLGDVPERVEAWDERLDLRVGDTMVELHYLGPADGEATTVVYLPEEQIVFTADLYETRAISSADVVDDKHFLGVRQVLNTISEWELQHAISTHSPETDPAILRENAQYYNDLYAAVKAEMDTAMAAVGGSVFGAYPLFDTLPGVLELPQYADWENYDTSFPKHVQRMLVSIYHGD